MFDIYEPVKVVWYIINGSEYIGSSCLLSVSYLILITKTGGNVQTCDKHDPKLLTFLSCHKKSETKFRLLTYLVGPARKNYNSVVEIERLMASDFECFTLNSF